MLLAIVLATNNSPAAENEVPAGPPIVLTNAVQIAALSNNVPANRYEAHFPAVILYVSPVNRRLYVQQGEHGVQVNLTNFAATLRPGNLIDVSGVVLGGSPTPQLVNSRAVVVGDAPLPKPKPAIGSQLAAGQDAFRYVTVRGMLRDMYATRNGFALQLVHNSFAFEVIVQKPVSPLPRDWLDAEVEVTGFGYPFLNPTTGRYTSFRFHANTTNDIRVLTPGIAERFEGRPLLTIAEAIKAPLSQKARIRVSGTVTVHRPGTAIFIDDGTGVMHIDALYRHLNPPVDAEKIPHEKQKTLQPGDRVEVVGARWNWFSLTPTLIQAEYRSIGKGEPVKPIKVSLQELMEGRHSGRLVTLDAQLLDFRAWSNASLRQFVSLVLRVENDVFQARFEHENAANWDLKAGAYVRITGVNDAEGSANRTHNTFQLLLRSPDDVVPLPTPPFWSRKEFQRIALAAGVVALLAGAWIVTQRVQMRRLEGRVAARTTDLRSANEQLQREVDQRRVAEESLRSSEARKAAVLEAALDSIITIDQQGRILDFNPAAEQTFGYRRDDVLGKEMAELIVPPAWRERHRAGLRRAVETGIDTMVGRRVEVPALRRDGEEVQVELALSRITTDQGPVFTAHIQDISERKRAEAERERALAHEKELNELKSRFVSMVSHEFRTPLGIITSSADILDAYLDRLSPEERQSNIRDITDATRHMSRMMEEVLLLGRVEAGKMTCRPGPLDLAVLCQRLVDEVMAATSGRCPIQLQAQANLPEAQADESLLRHAFTNLLNNASKYSAEGSPVEFRVAAREHLAIFTVTDRGIGIPEDDARLLFQAFHRGRNVGETPGTGLGMTIVKRCVELHGGKIAFESKEGSGSTFVVALPLFGSEPAANGSNTTFLFRSATQHQKLNFIS